MSDHIFFIGGFFPSNIQDHILRYSKRNVQIAADVLQKAYIQGLKPAYSSLQVYSIPFVGTFPISYKKIYISASNFSEDGLVGKCLAQITIPIFGMVWKYLVLKRELKNNQILLNKNAVIIIYSLHTPFLKAAIAIKKINPNIRICVIIPDLPQYMSDSHNYLYLVLKKIDFQIIQKSLSYCDGFVVLSNHMVTKLNIQHKPYVRVEGIYDGRYVEHAEKEQYPTIMYSGALSHRYGILNLLKAFSMIESADYRLWICGAGDTHDTILQMSRIDKRIIYKGQLPRDEILLLQRRATILVNPRISKSEFTKYSFPSKTMEYLASATPCIMYKLPGMPDEYLDYIYVPKDESIEALKEKIEEIIQLKKSSLEAFGQKAASFIHTRKSPDAQLKIVVEMLNKL